MTAPTTTYLWDGEPITVEYGLPEPDIHCTMDVPPDRSDATFRAIAELIAIREWARWEIHRRGFSWDDTTPHHDALRVSTAALRRCQVTPEEQP